MVVRTDQTIGNRKPTTNGGEDMNLSEYISEEYHDIMDSIMPGGANWQASGDDCFKLCLYYSMHSDHEDGPGDKLCSDEWRDVAVEPIVLMVLKHIFEYFDYYNRGDLTGDDLDARINQILTLLELPEDYTPSPTDIETIVKVRTKQCQFKRKLFNFWDGCSLNIEINNRYLIASHIIPWSECNDNDRVNPHNGLLLPPNYDYLFDKHLISFNDDGSILLSGDQSIPYDVLGIKKDVKLRKVPEETIPFLKKHRKQV